MENFIFSGVYYTRSQNSLNGYAKLTLIGLVFPKSLKMLFINGKSSLTAFSEQNAPFGGSCSRVIVQSIQLGEIPTQKFIFIDCYILKRNNLMHFGLVYFRNVLNNFYNSGFATLGSIQVKSSFKELNFIVKNQKQPPEVFCKKRCS